MYLLPLPTFSLTTIKAIISTCFIFLATAAVASPLDLAKRQSAIWKYCQDSAAPSNFRAFDLGGCTAQLTFDKDEYIGIQWAFDVTYAAGSTTTLEPSGDTDANFGVSDTFYTNKGYNFLTRLPGSSAFTAVHEFTNVCQSDQIPVSWRFYTTSANSAYSSLSYRYTTGQIRVVGGVSRPAKVGGVSLRRTSDSGNFTVGWSAVTGAAAYSVIVQYPTGTDEAGNPYLNLRGARVQVS